jgi:hypothetical protein
MTEQEWLACDDPTVMLDFLRGQTADRKLRLFAVAWLRHPWAPIYQERNREYWELAERYADGQAGPAELHEAWISGYSSSAITFQILRPSAEEAVASSLCALVDSRRGKAKQVALLRDIFGNPFRPPSPLDASVLTWSGGTVVTLARSIYQDRHFDDLPVLADALEEAGCTDAALLEHLRGPGPHVRGCWAVDLILAKDR